MGAGEVRLTGRLICASDVEAEVVRRYLPEHIRLSRAEPGCLSFNVEATDDPLVWSVDESFVDREAFMAHQSRTQTSAWSSATTAIGREYQVFGLE
jgi:quinol monooxygenase YgiN